MISTFCKTIRKRVNFNVGFQGEIAKKINKSGDGIECGEQTLEPLVVKLKFF
jgi:hypothetical protein